MAARSPGLALLGNTAMASLQAVHPRSRPLHLLPSQPALCAVKGDLLFEIAQDLVSNFLLPIFAYMLSPTSQHILFLAAHYFNLTFVLPSSSYRVTLCLI